MEQAVVPSVVGLPATTAEAILRAAGLRMSPSAPMGSGAHVRSQAPPAGIRVSVNSTVSVILAT